MHYNNTLFSFVTLSSIPGRLGVCDDSLSFQALPAADYVEHATVQYIHLCVSSRSSIQLRARCKQEQLAWHRTLTLPRGRFWNIHHMLSCWKCTQTSSRSRVMLQLPQRTSVCSMLAPGSCSRGHVVLQGSGMVLCPKH